MALQFKFKFAGGILAINARDAKELITQVSFFDECPRQCGACQSKNLGMKHRVAQQYDFYELICKDCGYFYSLGQRQDGSGLYPRGNKDTGDWDPPYQGNDGGGQDYQEPPPRQQQRPPTQQRQQPQQQRPAQGQQRAQGPPPAQQTRQQPARQQGPPTGSGPIQDGLDDDDIPF